LLGADDIEVIEGLVVGLTFDPQRPRRVTGVTLRDGSTIPADAVVVTTGTFLGGILHTGAERTPGGRVGEAPATGLSQQLAAMGFRMSRLKTGTPPRLDGRTIDYAQTEQQPSEDPVPRFTRPDDIEPPPPLLPQVHCWLTWTGPQTHDLIRQRIHESPMYSGQITGRGPRYCPSIEDKVVRFAHRDRHQVFLEPEGLDTNSVYPNGVSTSLPAEIQAAFIATIEGLQDAVMLRPGYAVEYDAVDARGLTHALASKDHEGLYFAGQVNGTSGYEEAGGQGLVAGANAALFVCGRAPVTIARDQGYIGVMIDDLVTQGCDEPYRMFTSRAEYRIILREDNADSRLSELGRAAGLVSTQRHERVVDRLDRVRSTADRLREGDEAEDVPVWLQQRAHAELTYAGYIQRMHDEVARMRGEGAEDLPLPTDLDYEALPGLSNEMRQRLIEVRPTSTAQASRIPGMTPAGLMCLWAFARQRQRQQRAEARSASRTDV
jgi:tRNA uridine 5-carboxymethylaminomethyl modification enzyme